MTEFNVNIEEETAQNITISYLKYLADEYPPEREAEFLLACKEILHFIMIPQEWEQRYNDDFVQYSEQNEAELIHNFVGQDKYKNKTAEVWKDQRGFFVDMYRDGNLVESRPLYDHSESYAESCAENWVMGVINEAGSDTV